MSLRSLIDVLNRHYIDMPNTRTTSARAHFHNIYGGTTKEMTMQDNSDSTKATFWTIITLDQPDGTDFFPTVWPHQSAAQMSRSIAEWPYREEHGRLDNGDRLLLLSRKSMSFQLGCYDILHLAQLANWFNLPVDKRDPQLLAGNTWYDATRKMGVKRHRSETCTNEVKRLYEIAVLPKCATEMQLGECKTIVSVVKSWMAIPPGTMLALREIDNMQAMSDAKPIIMGMDLGVPGSDRTVYTEHAVPPVHPDLIEQLADALYYGRTGDMTLEGLVGLAIKQLDQLHTSLQQAADDHRATDQRLNDAMSRNSRMADKLGHLQRAVDDAITERNEMVGQLTSGLHHAHKEMARLQKELAKRR